MKRILIGVLAYIALTLAAHAQTAPGWTYGYVPTTAQWNQQWASKQDYLGAPPLLITGGTMTGPLITAVSAAANAGFNLPPGTAPTSPNNGDLWSTSSGFYGQVNGVTVGPFVGAGSGTFAATAPLAVSFPSSVVTYALNFNTSLVNTGGNLGINLAHSNVFTATQSISLNAAALPAGQTGTIFQVGGADGTSPRIEIDGFGTGNTTGVPRFTCVRSDGTNASPTTLQSGDEICSLNSFGYNGSAFAGPQAGVRMYAAANWTTTSNGTYVRISTTATSDASHVITDRIGIEQDGGIVTLNAGALPTGGSKGNGTLNLYGSLYNNGTAPTGSGGGYVLATGPTVSALTVTGSFTAAGLVTNADLVNTTMVINGTTCTLGSSCSPTATAASITVGTTGVASGTSNGLLYNNGAILGNLATANSGVLITSGAGVPSIATTLPSGITAPALVVTSSFTATGLVTNADLANASITVNGSTCTLGSSCTPSAPVTVGSTVVNSGSNGFFLYDNAGTLGNLGTTGSAGLVVLSNSPTIASLTVNTAFTATGLVTAADLFGTTGSSGNVVLANSPTLTGAPVLAAPTATTIAIGGCTIGANAFCVTGTSNISGRESAGALTLTGAASNLLVAGLNGATNPVFNVDASTALQVAGISIVGAVTGGTVAVVVTDSGANASLTINAKGTGTIGIGSVSTGAVTITPATTITGVLTLSGGLNTPLVGTYGGTGVNNGSNTITVAGNFSTSAALAITAGSTGQLAYWSSGTAIGGENITSALTAGTNISIAGTTNATIGITGQIALANGGTNANLTASNGGVVYSTSSALAILAGTATAGQCLLSGSSAAPTWGSCSGAAAVSSVANSDGTMTISPTTGAVVASLALGHANTWTGVQTFTNSDLALLGSSTGSTAFASANAGATNYTVTFPAANATLASLNVSDQTISGGANVTPYNPTTGNITVDCGKSPLQWQINTGAFTITAPTSDGSCILEEIGGNGAGAITWTNFSNKSPVGTTYTATATATATVTFSNGSANITWTANALNLNSPVFFTTSGGLPTNFTAGTVYYVSSTGTNTIQVAATPGGSAVVAGSAGSGTQTGTQPTVFDISIARVNGVAMASLTQVQ